VGGRLTAREGLDGGMDGGDQGGQVAVIHTAGVEAASEVIEDVDEVGDAGWPPRHGHFRRVVLHHGDGLDGLDDTVNNIDG
jgi:hypothetical protein